MDTETRETVFSAQATHPGLRQPDFELRGVSRAQWPHSLQTLQGLFRLQGSATGPGRRLNLGVLLPAPGRLRGAGITEKRWSITHKSLL